RLAKRERRLGDARDPALGGFGSRPVLTPPNLKLGPMTTPKRDSPTTTSLQAEVKDRLGVLPNFFCLGEDAPEITTNLWGFAQFGYLDNPLPSVFKERLFVYL